jgi:GrpB-like predicted nucleotidyltransferase (UPF0157 family)
MSTILSKINEWFGPSKDIVPQETLTNQSTSFGLRKGKVNLIEIDLEVWKKIYLIEKESLLKDINTFTDGENDGSYNYEEGKNITVSHSGSTSFNNIKAKPILDILIGFNNKADLLKAKTRLLKNTKDTLRVLMTPGTFGFYLIGKVEGDKVIAHYHLSIIGSRAYKDHNSIQYMLRNNYKILKEYEQLKNDLSIKYKNNRFAYTSEKQDFLHAMIFRKKLLDQRNLLNKYSRI